MNRQIRILRRKLDEFSGKIRINDKGEPLESGGVFLNPIFLYCRFGDEIGGKGSPVEILDGGSSDKLDVCGTCELFDAPTLSTYVIYFYGCKVEENGRVSVMVRCCHDKECVDDFYDFDDVKDECERLIDDFVVWKYGVNDTNNVVFEWCNNDIFVE